MNYAEKVWDTFTRAMKGDLKAQAEILYVDAMLNGDNRLIKEEKKMLNIDKYREELLEEMKFKKEKLNDCENDNYNGVEIYFRSIEAVKRRHGGGCSQFFSDDVKWLFSEYEPPLLENGDGLRPGDWIMVRDVDSQSFVRRQFLYFFDGKFVCSAPNSTPLEGFGEPWKQARLPEDGE